HILNALRFAFGHDTLRHPPPCPDWNTRLREGYVRAKLLEVGQWRYPRSQSELLRDLSPVVEFMTLLCRGLAFVARRMALTTIFAFAEMVCSTCVRLGGTVRRGHLILRAVKRRSCWGLQ